MKKVTFIFLVLMVISPPSAHTHDIFVLKLAPMFLLVPHKCEPVRFNFYHLKTLGFLKGTNRVTISANERLVITFS